MVSALLMMILDCPGACLLAVIVIRAVIVASSGADASVVSFLNNIFLPFHPGTKTVDAKRSMFSQS